MISHITSDLATWCTLILLLVIHLATNYAAVRAVSMQSLNRQRANILFSHILQYGIVLSPKEVSVRERIFERGGVLRWADDEVLGKCRIGTSLSELLGRIGRRDKLSGSLAFCSSGGGDGESEVDVYDLLSIFEAEDYVLWATGEPAAYEAVIVLKAGCGPIDQLRAWAHALLIAERRQRGGGDGGGTRSGLGGKPDGVVASGAAKAAAKHGLVGELKDTLYEVRRMFDKYGDEMRAKGWNLDVAALETKAGMRLQISPTGPCTSD